MSNFVRIVLNKIMLDDIMEEEKKSSIYFKDLSLSLKILVVFGWIMLALNIIFFIFGFIVGLIEGV